MDISVANAAKFDIDLNILCPCGPASNLMGFQWRVCGVGGVAGN
jgi:hypothetical protein